MVRVIETYAEMRGELAKLADDEYREFVMRGIPSERPFVGVRIPQVREIVARVSAERIDEFLAVEPVAFEEVLARGMLICRLSYEKLLEQFDSQVACIDDWCACDTFCSGVAKLIKKHRTEFFEEVVDKLLTDDAPEFAVRTGLVLMKCAYVEPEWLQVIFDRVERLGHREEYYIRMAIAWLLCDLFIKYPTATTGYMVSATLPKWTFNKTISKICDSYRVESEVKDYLKRMRK